MTFAVRNFARLSTSCLMAHFEEGVANMVKNCEFEGKGHSVAIHSNNPEHVEYCGIHCSVSRCIVNQPAGTTGGGSPTNGYPPTATLGCGSWGNNSFSGNFNYEHLMNGVLDIHTRILSPDRQHG